MRLLIAALVMVATNWLGTCFSGEKEGEPVKVIREGVEPAPEEQLFIYLLNKARHDPAAYGKEIGLDLGSVAWCQPAAPSKELTASARFRAGDMLKRNYFGHVDPDGLGPNFHALESGYKLARRYGRGKDSNFIESIQAGIQAPAEILKDLIIDAGTPSLGHRKHLLGMSALWAAAREIGAGIVIPGKEEKVPYSAYSAFHTARTDQVEAFATGVVYDDKNGNGAYDTGEGLGGVLVSIGGGPGIKTMAHGGFAIPVQPGPVVVGCQKGDFKGQATARIQMDDRNVHLEFISGKKEAVVNFGKPIPAKTTPADVRKK